LKPSTTAWKSQLALMFKWTYMYLECSDNSLVSFCHSYVIDLCIPDLWYEYLVDLNIFVQIRTRWLHAIEWHQKNRRRDGRHAHCRQLVPIGWEIDLPGLVHSTKLERWLVDLPETTVPRSMTPPDLV
jgi:hypothetical protein